MNTQVINTEKKTIRRSIYGLLVLLVFVFVMVFTFIQIQNSKIERLKQIAYSYHLSIGEKSQGILSAIAEMNLWFKNAYIIEEENRVRRVIHNLSDTPIHVGISAQDKISSFDYEVKKYIGEIRVLNDEFRDDEFTRISALLFKSYIQVIENLKIINQSDIGDYKNIDEISSSLRTVAHQLSRLHKLEYQKKRNLIDESIKENQKQLVILIIALLIISAVGVVKLLQHLNSTLAELVTVNKEKEFNQARFESMFESISDAVIVADTDRNISLLNSSVKKMFGFEKEELIGHKTSMLYANIEDFSQMGKQTYNAAATIKAAPYELEYRRKDGTVFWGETLGTKIVSDDGIVFGFIGIIRNITERKKIEKLIMNNESRLNEAQRLAKVGSWELDLLTGELLWSDEIFNMFEIDKTKFEPTYEEFLNAIHPDDRGSVNEAYSNSLVDRLPYEITHRLKMRDGTIKHVHEKCESDFDEEHKPIRSVGTVQDITEIKLAEDELRKYRTHLEELIEERTKKLHQTQDELVRKERLATLGQLTATVSHELRNPLSAMHPSLYIIEKKSDKSDEQMQKAIERIDRNIGRCDRIIDELLDFTRITELNREATHFDDWLESVIDEQKLPNEIHLEKEFSLNDVSLIVDRDRLRRVVINVFENACHAMMDENKKIVNVKNAVLKIKTKLNGERIEIIVIDNGSGMTASVLDKIYEPLFSTKGFGVGMGMSTVKQIIKQHSGDIEIESKEGQGTTVTLWLPTKVFSQNISVG